MVELIKKAALDAVKESRPTSIVFGTVISIEPLKINVEQKLTLTSAQLILTHGVVDYDVDITVDHLTENRSGGSGEAAFASHNHGYVGKKTITIHNGLKNGDEVLMIQVQGGQKYIVLERMVKA